MKNPKLIIPAAVLAVVCAAWLSWRFLAPPPSMRNSDVIAASAAHAYQFIAAPGITWDKARGDAAALSWQGHAGYLATIEDAGEYQFVIDHLFPHAYPDVTYLGGRQTAPGEWRWVTGPSGAADGGKGLLFWRGYEQGAVQGGHYANWMSTAFQHDGKWDVAKVCCVSLFSYGVPQFSTSLGNGDSEEHVAGFIVEFGR